MINNYVRVGHPPHFSLFSFDDSDPAERERVKAAVTLRTNDKASKALPIAMWRRCKGLEYPIVGEYGGSRLESVYGKYL